MMRHILAVLIWLLWVPMAAAQGEAAPLDYERWQTLAETTETQLADPGAEDVVFEALRTQLVEMRDQFRVAQTQNAERIATIDRQLGALRDQGEAETDDALQARIAALEESRANLRRPQLEAEEAAGRADGLIAEIDTLLRERQSEILMSRVPSPLLPGSWPASLQALGQSVTATLAPNLSALPDIDRSVLIGHAVLGLAGVMLGLFARFGVMRLARRPQESLTRSAAFVRLIAALFQLALGLAAAYLVVAALDVPRLLDARHAAIHERLFFWAGALIAVRWLSVRLSEPGADGPALTLSLGERIRLEGLAGLAVIWVIAMDWLVLTAEADRYDAATRADAGFVLVAAGGVLVGLLGVVLRGAAKAVINAEGEEPSSYSAQLIGIIARLCKLAGLVAIVAAAAGFINLGQWLVYATLRSLAVFGAIMVLQRAAEDITFWITGKTASLFPVLAGFVVSLASLPLLALIWGARWSDLAGLWERAIEGVSIGGTRLSLTNLATFFVVFAVIFFATRLVQGTLRRSVLPKTALEPGAQTALLSGLGYIGAGLALIVAVTAAGINLSGLAIVAGALSVGIGFGLQTIVSNFVSGIILLIERPISDGDWIEVGGQMGYVRNISVRATTIETFDRTNVIVPNADLVSGQVINWTKSSTVGRVIVPVRVALDSDTQEVERILQEVATTHPNVLLNPPPAVVFQAIERDALFFEIRAILRDVNWMLDVRTALNHEIMRRFKAEGIKIPRPQQDVWLQNNPADLAM